MSQTLKKIHSRDEFELCYLRHQYLRKVKVAPTREEQKPYESIATHFAKNTYFMYKNLFRLVGFEVDDVIDVAKTHITSYFGLFSLEQRPNAMDEFYNIFRKNNDGAAPTEKDILNKNKADFTSFIKQRMEDLVRVCRQKARNIKGLPTEEYFVFRGLAEPPKPLKELIRNHERFGYRKVDVAVFKSIKRRAKLPDGTIFKVGDEYFVVVANENKNLSINDFSGAGLDPYDSIHNMTPEQVYTSTQEVDYWERRKKAFENTPLSSRVRLIKRFISTNKTNPLYKDEVRTARKMLKEMGETLAGQRATSN
jgi:hypothetical protein